MKTINLEPEIRYSLSAVIRLTGSPRRKILFYYRKGIIPAEECDGDLRFDDESVILLRHVESLRIEHRMNWAAIYTIITLHQEVEDLREKLRRYR